MVVRLYTRRGCHLCTSALAALYEEQTTGGFQLIVHDVDADPEWQDLYGHLVPVTVLPGGAELHYRVDRDQLRAALRS